MNRNPAMHPCRNPTGAKITTSTTPASNNMSIGLSTYSSISMIPKRTPNMPPDTSELAINIKY
jgi:hypothetical protein